MPRTSDKRERLVDAAVNLFHQRGYGQTSLSDIAEHSGVPLGNVYYYFKTKDDLANAVIDERIHHQQTMFQHCEQANNPQASLFKFLDTLVEYSGDISRYGCPIASLCQELNKDESELANKADILLGQAIKWTTQQFKLMGKSEPSKLSQHLMSTMHGASLLANTFSKPRIIKEEAARMKEWINNL